MGAIVQDHLQNDVTHPWPQLCLHKSTLTDPAKSINHSDIRLRNPRLIKTTRSPTRHNPIPQWTDAMDRSFFRVAAATLRAALILISPGLNTRLQAIEQWASVIMPPQGSTDFSTRDLQRQIDSAIERSASFLRTQTPHEYYSEAKISEGDMEVALSAVEDALQKSVEIFSPRDLLMSRNTPSEIAAKLQPNVRRKWDRDGVSEAAQQAASLVLQAVCFQLVKWVQEMPTIQNQAAWRTLANSWKLISSTDQIIAELQNTGWTQARDPNSIAHAQRRDLVSAYGKMELFGLPVESRYRRIPISVSYVTARGILPSTGKDRPLPFNLALRQLLANSSAMRGSGLRLLVTGRAGSGKTTAAQWLAYQSGIGTLRQIDWHFGLTIPFFVKLRSIFDNETAIPPDSRLLMSGELREGLGPNWLQPLAGGGYQPLIVLDGWDELKASSHELAEAWLTSLCDRLPNAHIIVTSRPEGISQSASSFARQKFMRVTLVRLREVDKTQIISRWYEGLAENILQVPEINEHELANSRNQLLQDIKSPGLAEITDTPLMVSMLACLYATSPDRNPPSRQALYETVASNLIHFRDYYRQVSTGEWDDLRLVQKERIFGQIALEMVSRNKYTIPVRRSVPGGQPSVEKICRDILPEFGHAAATAGELTDALVSRSVVVQRVGDEELEFVHKSFQEYFSGIAFARQGNLDELFDLIEQDETYLPLATFAVQSGVEGVADRVISWLISILKRNAIANRRNALFTLLECVHAAPTLKPASRVEATAAASEIFPPRNMEEAVSLARLGDASTEFLSPDKCPPEFDPYSIESLFLIGTTKSLKMLQIFAKARGDFNTAELAATWDRTSDDRYADMVLSQIKTGLRLKATSIDRLNKIFELKGTTEVGIAGLPLNTRILEGLNSLPNLRDLQIRRCTGLGDLPNLKEIPLQSIHLSEMTDLGHLGQIGGRSLLHVGLTSVSAASIDWELFLTTLPNLRVLWLEEVRTNSKIQRHDPIASIPSEFLSKLPHLTTVAIQVPDAGSASFIKNPLQFLSATSKLRKLKLFTPIERDDLLLISEIPALSSLDLRLSISATGGAEMERLTSLKNLAISNCDSTCAAKFSRMNSIESLSVRASTLTSMGRVDLPVSARSLTLSDCSLSYSDFFTGKSVSHLTITRGEVENVDFLQYFPRLKSLKLEDISGVSDISGISSVPDGCRVEITGIGLEDDTPIEHLRAAQRCAVYYEPTYWWGGDQAVS